MIDNAFESGPQKKIDVMAKESLNLQHGLGFTLPGVDQAQNLVKYVSEMNRLLSSFAQSATTHLENDVSQSWIKLASNERQFLIDVFCWSKDEFSAAAFAKLLPYILISIKDNPQATFTLFNSYEFHLFIKSKFEFYNFDQEEQNYPESDNFFITKDFSFLFQYKDNELFTEEVELVLEKILQVVGSEYFISKLQISNADTYQLLQEEAYNWKNTRLASAGYPSYEDSLVWQTPYNLKSIRTTDLLTLESPESNSKSIVKSDSDGANYDLISTLQAVFEFKKSNEEFDFEFPEKILKESLEEVLSYVKLGKQYLMSTGSSISVTKDLYRIGRTLLIEGKKAVKEFRSILLNQSFSWDFLGDTVISIADDFSSMKLVTPKNLLHQYTLSNYVGVKNALALIKCIRENLSLIEHYWDKYQVYKTNSSLNFVNYRNDQITWETLFLTDFINGVLKVKDNKSLSVMDLRSFVSVWKDSSVEESQEQMNIFIDRFNLKNTVKDREILCSFLANLIKIEILDLDYSAMMEDDYKFIGGVLLV